MIFSPEGVVSSEDYEYQIKAVCKMVSNRNHAFGAAEVTQNNRWILGQVAEWLMIYLPNPKHSTGLF